MDCMIAYEGGPETQEKARKQLCAAAFDCRGLPRTPRGHKSASYAVVAPILMPDPNTAVRQTGDSARKLANLLDRFDLLISLRGIPVQVIDVNGPKEGVDRTETARRPRKTRSSNQMISPAAPIAIATSGKVK